MLTPPTPIKCTFKVFLSVFLSVFIPKYMPKIVDLFIFRTKTGKIYEIFIFLLKIMLKYGIIRYETRFYKKTT